MKPLKHVVTLCFEMPLQRELMVTRKRSACDGRLTIMITFSCATWLGSNKGIAASCILGECRCLRKDDTENINIRVVRSAIQEGSWLISASSATASNCPTHLTEKAL